MVSTGKACESFARTSWTVSGKGKVPLYKADHLALRPREFFSRGPIPGFRETFHATLSTVRPRWTIRGSPASRSILLANASSP